MAGTGTGGTAETGTGGTAGTSGAGALAGRRVLVVGASAGIGRATAIAAVRAGATVVMAARRADALATAIDEAGGGIAVTGDICADGGAERLVADAVAALGEIDLIVSTVGFADLRRLVDTSPETWHRTLDANVIGFNQLARAALDHMAEGGIVAVLSSETAGAPRLGLVPYAASKAALEVSLRGWRAEQHAVRFTCIVVGATQPSEFGAAFEMPELERAIASWVQHGLMQEAFMHTDDVANVLVGTLATLLAAPGIGLEEFVLRSPSPVAGPTWTNEGASRASTGG